MTDEMLSAMLSDELNQHINANRKNLLAGLRSALPAGAQPDPQLEQLLIATIQVSAQLSAHFIIRSLEMSGILTLPPDGTPIIRKNEE